MRRKHEGAQQEVEDAQQEVEGAQREVEGAQQEVGSAQREEWELLKQPVKAQFHSLQEGLGGVSKIAVPKRIVTGAKQE